MPLTQTAPAKVNLTLRVVGRRDDGYHEIESLAAFATLADTLTFEPGLQTSLAIGGPFAAQCGPLTDNLVLKAAAALLREVPGLKAGHFRLDKNIPVAAGLGGGSADAAAALRLLVAQNGIEPSDARLFIAARSIGADVAVCLDPRPRVMRGVGEKLSAPLALPSLHVVLVNPGVAVATRDVFAAFDQRYASSAVADDIPTGREPLIAWLAARRNDLTDAAASRAPAIRQVLAALSALSGCRLARMSGSGATCFALFDAADETAYAAEKLRAAHGAWWICPAVLN